MSHINQFIDSYGKWSIDFRIWNLGNYFTFQNWQVESASLHTWLIGYEFVFDQEKFSVLYNWHWPTQPGASSSKCGYAAWL